MIDDLIGSLVKQVSDRVAEHSQSQKWWLAYSGGLDSTVLLHICSFHLKLNLSHQLTAIYVDHQLQTHSSTWANHCREVCNSLNVSCQVSTVDVCPEGNGVEAAARSSRYQVFQSSIGLGEGLLMAHHQDDQAETFLLRVLRGSGVKGLSAMPVNRALGDGFLLRPLLAASKSELLAYAEHYQLNWIEDPSNQSLDFDRNFLRQQVIPLLQTRWPEFASSAAKSVQLCAQSEQLNRILAEQDFSLIKVDSLAGEGLGLTELAKLPSIRQINLVRWWLSGVVDYLPDGETIQYWLDQFQSAAIDAMPQIHWQGLVIRRYQQAIYLTSESSVVPTDFKFQPLQSFVLENESLEKEGPGKGGLEKKSFEKGSFESKVVLGQGVRYQSDQHFEVVFTDEREKYYLAGRPGGRSLKKIFQEQQVPYWLRAHWPVLLVDKQSAALLGFSGGPLVLEGFQVAKNEEGLLPLWRFSNYKKADAC